MSSLSAEAELKRALCEMGLAETHTPMTLVPLAGGVSSDIFRATLGDRTLCVKRARAKLAVAGDWRAPVGRSSAEVAWLELASGLLPDHVPRVLGSSSRAGAFAMDFLDPAEYPTWKSQLASGHIEADTARAVARVIGVVHAATAGRADIAARFDHRSWFHALRIEPYLLATAEVHPDLGPWLRARAEALATADIALVHGDVSPKNLLIGPRGPVLLDAECACWGDPAFDVAFCLNHLLLKGAWHPADANALGSAFTAFTDAYRDEVDWEPVADLEARVAGLLPALMLARVDGKSPVEYLDSASARRVRDFARPFVAEPAPLAALGSAWCELLS